MFRSVSRSASNRTHPSHSGSDKRRRHAHPVETLESRLLLTTASVHSFDFGQGFTGNAIALNGGASYSGSSLRLLDGGTNQTRSAFYSAKVPITAFQSNFDLQFSNAVADGITFAIQGVGVTALGTGGSGLGYQGIGANSVAITFNLDGSGNFDGSSGYYTGGANPQGAGSVSLAPLNLRDGDVIDVSISYSGTTLVVTETDQTTNESISQTYSNVNLYALLGNSTFGYVGFTGGTSASAATANILRWTYLDNSGIPSIGLNENWPTTFFTDAMKFSTWSTGTQLDTNGWPLQQTLADLTLGGGGGSTYMIYGGTYTISFPGQAPGGFTMTSTWYGPGGPGANSVSAMTYDSGTNTTSATLTIDPAHTGAGFSSHLYLNNTNGNVRNIRILMPGADPAKTFNQQAMTLAGNFDVIRYMVMTAASRSVQLVWADRTLPGYATQVQTKVTSLGTSPYAGNGMAWEYVVQFANETGKDIWINIPENVDSTYITNLANLLKYGSDGVNPYTSTQTNPVWAPLNSNLKVYLEFSNEVWNSQFSETQQNQAYAVNAVTAWLTYQQGGPLTDEAVQGGQIDYDAIAGGTIIPGGPYPNQQVLNDRMHTLHLKNSSDLFRAVFGDSQMGSRIRPVYAWWAGGTGTTGNGSDGLAFLNAYFNNADGVAHVATPHPVNYFLWGGGSAYYPLPYNTYGTDSLTLTNANMELSYGWSFTSAGYIANGDPKGNPNAPEGTHAAYIQNGGNMRQTVKFSAAQSEQISFDLASAAGSSGTLTIYYNGTSVGTVAITASMAYSAKLSNAFTSSVGSYEVKFAYSGTGYVFIDQVSISPVANSSFEPGSLMGWSTAGTVGTAANGSGLGNPSALDGVQAAYIQNSGSLTQSISFSSGPSDIAVTLAKASSASGTVSVYYDGQPVGSFTPTTSYVTYRTSVQTNGASPTAHTIQLSFSGSGYVFVDEVEIESVNSMINAGMKPLGGLPSDVRVAESYGLQVAGYEGSYQFGMNSPNALQLLVKDDPRATAGVQALLNQYYTMGGALPVYFSSESAGFGLLPDYTQSTSFKLDGVLAVKAATQPATQASLNANASLMGIDPVNGNLYPAGLTNPRAQNDVVIIKTAGWYQLGVSMDPSKPTTVNITLDGSLLGTLTVNGSNSTASYRRWLLPGVHSLQVTDIAAVGSAAGYVYNLTITPDFGAVSDIGSPSKVGTLDLSSGAYTITGAGTGVTGISDQANFVYSTLSGNQALIGRVSSMSYAGASSAAGVMFRNSAAVGDMTAALVAINNGAGSAAKLLWRTSSGASIQSSQLTIASPNTTPVWLKLVRSGNGFSGYYSTDGASWTQIGTDVTVNMAASALGGLTVASGVSSTGNTVNIDNVQVAGLPTIVTAAYATNVTATSASLSVTAANGLGRPDMTYTWATLGTPPAPVTFGASNGSTSAGQNLLATFTAAGSYTLQVTVTEPLLGSSTTSQITIEVPSGSLITNMSVTSGKTYPLLSGLAVGSKVYLDTFDTATYTTVPSEVAGATFVQTSRSDYSYTNNPFMTFTLTQEAYAYVGYKTFTTKPSWLDGTWTDTGTELVTSASQHMRLYKKLFPAGAVNLGANQAGGGTSTMMYVVVAKPSVVPLTITDLWTASGSAYPVQNDLEAGGKVYLNSFDVATYSSVPTSVAGTKFIQTDRNDSARTDNPFLTFAVNRTVDVYVGYKTFTTRPSWLDGTWTDTGEELLTSASQHMHLYKKAFTAGTVSLGGNQTGGGTSTMTYVVAVKATAGTGMVVNNLWTYSGTSYPIVDSLSSGDKVYVESYDTATYTTVPAEVSGGTFFQTSRADSTVTASTAMTFDVSAAAKVYVGYQTGTTLPNWIDGTWTDTGLNVLLSNGITMRLYERNYSAGTVSLGGNAAGGGNATYSYVVIVLPQ